MFYFNLLSPLTSQQVRQSKYTHTYTTDMMIMMLMISFVYLYSLTITHILLSTAKKEQKNEGAKRLEAGMHAKNLTSSIVKRALLVVDQRALGHHTQCIRIRFVVRQSRTTGSRNAWNRNMKSLKLNMYCIIHIYTA